MAEDTRECPRCAETIKAKAAVCRFCGHDLAAGQNPVPPQESVPVTDENITAVPRKSAGRKFLGFLGYLLLISAALALGWFLEREGYILEAYNRITGYRYAADLAYADACSPVDLREGRVPYALSVRGSRARAPREARADHIRGNLAPRDPRTAGHPGGRKFVNVEAVKAAVAKDPDNPNNEYNLGTAYLLNGEYDRAVTHLERATVLLPADDQAYANLASAYLAAGRTGAAEEAALSALQYNRDRALAANVLGLVALKRKDDADALKMLQDGAADHPGASDFQVNLGNLYREQGNTDMARRKYLKAVEADAGNGAASLNLGNMAYADGKYGDALKYWKQALNNVHGLGAPAVERLKRNIAAAERKK